MFGDILSISRLRMGTDGNGISTLVVFFDCPLYKGKRKRYTLHP